MVGISRGPEVASFVALALDALCLFGGVYGLRRPNCCGRFSGPRPRFSIAESAWFGIIRGITGVSGLKCWGAYAFISDGWPV